MRHHNQNRKFGRETDQRRALLKSLARSLVLTESIETTTAKAKELRPYVEKIITESKAPTLSGKRRIQALLGNEAYRKLIGELGPRFGGRNGGYTRITKTRVRASGGTPLARISLLK